MRFSTTPTVSAGIGSEEVQPFSLSLEAEMMLEQLKEQHLREMEDLRNQLQSKVGPGDSLPFLFFQLLGRNLFHCLIQPVTSINLFDIFHQNRNLLFVGADQ